MPRDFHLRAEIPAEDMAAGLPSAFVPGIVSKKKEAVNDIPFFEEHDITQENRYVNELESDHV